MAEISAEDLKAVILPQAHNMPGFDIRHEVKGGADITPGTRAVETHLDKDSLAHAKERNDSGVNTRFAAEKPVPDASPALASVTAGNDSAQKQYRQLFDKHGLGKKIDMIRTRNEVLTRTPNGAQTSPKDALRRKHFERTDKDLKDVPDKKDAAFNPDMLPQATKDRLEESAMLKGEHVAPTGKTIVPSPAGVGRMALSATRAAFRRWEHALEGGYIDVLSFRRK